MTHIRSSMQSLSQEAKDCIRRTLEPSLGAEEVQRMIDSYEGTSPDPAAAAPAPAPAGAMAPAPTREQLWAPSPARSLEDGKEKLREVGGDRGALGLAAAGVDRLFTDSLPYDSLLERSYRNFRPTESLVPALDVALRSPEPKNPAEMLEVANQMFDALPVDPYDPMQKGFAGLRLLMAVVKKMGDVRVVGLDQMSTPLRNLRDDARSENLGRIMADTVRESFGELRTMLKDNPNPVTLQPSITEGVDTVTIGGVTLEVRR